MVRLSQILVAFVASICFVSAIRPAEREKLWNTNNNVPMQCNPFLYCNSPFWNSFPLANGYRYIDFNAISFLDFIQTDCEGGDVEGRLLVGRDVNLLAGVDCGGFSIGDKIRSWGIDPPDDHRNFSFVQAGNNTCWEKGNLFPDIHDPQTEGMFLNRDLCDLPTECLPYYLASRQTGWCPETDGNCAQESIEVSQTFYIQFANFWASQLQTIDLAWVVIYNGNILLVEYDLTENPTPPETIVVKIPNSVWNSVVGVSHKGFDLASTNLFVVIFNDDNSTTTFDKFTFGDRFRTVYILAGDGPQIDVQGAVLGSLIAPERVLNNTHGVIDGFQLVVGDTIQVHQVNKAPCLRCTDACNNQCNGGFDGDDYPSERCCASGDCNDIFSPFGGSCTDDCQCRQGYSCCQASNDPIPNNNICIPTELCDRLVCDVNGLTCPTGLTCCSNRCVFQKRAGWQCQSDCDCADGFFCPNSNLGPSFCAVGDKAAAPCVDPRPVYGDVITIDGEILDWPGQIDCGIDGQRYDPGTDPSIDGYCPYCNSDDFDCSLIVAGVRQPANPNPERDVAGMWAIAGATGVFIRMDSFWVGDTDDFFDDPRMVLAPALTVSFCITTSGLAPVLSSNGCINTRPDFLLNCVRNVARCPFGDARIPSWNGTCGFIECTVTNTITGRVYSGTQARTELGLEVDTQWHGSLEIKLPYTMLGNTPVDPVLIVGFISAGGTAADDSIWGQLPARCNSALENFPDPPVIQLH